MITRFFRALVRGLFVALRAFFILLMLVIPVPVGELFHKLFEGSRKAQPTQLKREE